MTWFPFIIVVIDNQNKGIEPTWLHSKVESGSDCVVLTKVGKNGIP
jgi:hypothetical protein